MRSSTFFGLALAGLALVHPAPLRARELYDISRLLFQGDLGSVGIDSSLSQNDNGVVATIFRLRESGTNAILEHVAAGTSAATMIDLTPEISSSFSPHLSPGGVEVSNQGTVMFRRQMTLTLGVPYTDILQYQIGVPSSRTIVYSLQGLSGIYSYVRQSNVGGYIFRTLENNTGHLYISTSEAAISIGLVDAPLRRPVLADNNTFIMRSGTLPNVRMYDAHVNLIGDVAGTAQGFTATGINPSVSPDGSVMGFCSSTASGKGIYVSVRTPSGLTAPVRVVGLQGDGVLDPGEAWSDSNGNGAVDTGEDTGGFSDFFLDDPVCVSDLSAPQAGYVVAIRAKDTSGTEGLFTVHLDVDLSGGAVLPHAPSSVVVAGVPFWSGSAFYTANKFYLYDGLNRKGQLAFWATNGSSAGVFRAEPVRKPIIIIPGIIGTLNNPALRNFHDWVVRRGVPPDQLKLEPILGTYNDMVQTLKTAGYVEGQDLFICNYDWRMPIFPLDGTLDGITSQVTSGELSAPNYRYAVDYLGASISAARQAWAVNHPHIPLTHIDLITHSTGGLLARAYIQSPAYGAVVTGGALPKIDRLLFMGVPNRGAPKAWNPLHDNWVSDPDYKYVVCMFTYDGFKKLIPPSNQVIAGPIAADDITIAKVTGPNGAPDPVKFINLYAPSVRALLSTENFLNNGNVNSDPAERNEYLLDLNNQLDLPGSTGDRFKFANSCEPFVLYGSDSRTITSTTTMLGHADMVIFHMTEFRSWPAYQGEPYFRDNYSNLGGDGTVPITSSVGLFTSDPRFRNMYEFTGVLHMDLVHAPACQRRVLTILGLSTVGVPISQSLRTGSFSQLNSVIRMYLDPVDGIISDAQGRRLGFRQSDGAISEIPGGIWWGGNDGVGFVFGAVPGPLTMTLYGLNQPFAAGAVGFQDNIEIGNGREGTLALGDSLAFVIGGSQSSTPASTGPLAVSLRVLKSPSVAGEPVQFQVSLPRPSTVQAEIVDVTGRIRRHIEVGFLSAGEHAFEWDGRDEYGESLASGVVFLRVTVEGKSRTTKIVLVN